MELIIEDLLLSLHRLIQLLGQLTPESYNKPCETVFGSTIGAHIRHDTDHFQCFLLGIGEGKVDYDARERLPEVENDPIYAAAYIRGICAGLEQLAVDVDLETQIQVKMDCGHEAPWAGSTIRRELQFLLSHTVHHNALISVIVRQETDLSLPTDFGVAPSSIKYRASQQH